MLTNIGMGLPQDELPTASETVCTEGDENPGPVSHTMNLQLKTALATEPRKMTAPVFNAAILYESLDAGTRAKQFTDQLATGVAANRVLSLDQWDFRHLGRRAIRNAAASAAAAAYMVILSMSGKNPLPAQVERWIEMWTWLIDRCRPAVVALFAGHHPESGRIRSHLRRGAASKGLTFFPETACRVTDGERPEGLPGSGQICGADSQRFAYAVQ